jgi:hypothetical protein
MKRTFATACLGLILGVACNSSSGGGGGGAATSSSAFVQDYCSLVQPCCAAAGLSTAGTQCQALAGAAGATESYNAANGQACITGMQAESGSATFCTTLGNDIPACNTAFTATSGSKPGGAACTEDSDCAQAPGGGATCFDDFAFDDGGTTQTETCIQTMVGQAGDGPCVGTVEASATQYTWSGSGAPPASGYTCDTASGLTCDGNTQKCVALAPVGQACQSDSDCVAGAYCGFGSSGSQCATRLADGASCVDSPTGCITTSYCDSTSSTCKPLLATGAPCSTSRQCSSQQCVNDVCSGGDSLGLQLLCGTN